MKTVAFVPIRLNSQRVEGKNLRELGGEPLLVHILRSLRAAKGIDEVYVYCSNPSIQEYLPKGVRFLQRAERTLIVAVSILVPSSNSTISTE